MGFKPNGFNYSWQGEKIKSEVTEMEKIIGNQILRLEKPSESLFQEFSLFVEDMRANKQTLWDPYLPKENEKPLDFVNRLLKRESGPEAPLVPETIYWATF
ncbi:MAG: hypothetical protein IPM97_15815 [Bdellovibrionaceae bacterium]|nr:hypothetical protein [Pseudobdellovibrionaceae bacterium]